MTEEIKYNKDEKWIPYKQLTETPQQTIDRLEQENKELKEKAPMKLIAKNNKYRSALEEIREILKFYADTWVDEKIYPNLHYDNTKAKEGLSIINEVLNA